MLRIFLIAAFCSIAASSCRRDEVEIIPRGTMSKIYAEIFLLDQQMHQQDNVVQRIADTTKVYEPIFEKYGYTYENFIASESKYLEDPKRFVRMAKKAANILTHQLNELKNEKKIQDALLDASKGVSRFIPHRIYLLDTIKDASKLLDFDFRQGLDTIFEGPRMVVWADTLMLRDSLSAADSVALRDSLSRLDSISRRRSDSLAFLKSLPKLLEKTQKEEKSREAAEVEQSNIPTKIDDKDIPSERKLKFNKMRELRRAKDK